MISVLKDKFSLPPCGGSMLCGGGKQFVYLCVVYAFAICVDDFVNVNAYVYLYLH